MMANRDSFPRELGDGEAILPVRRGSVSVASRDEVCSQMIGDRPNAKSLLLHANPTPYVKAVRRVYTAAFQSNNLKVAVPKTEVVMQKMVDVIESQREKGPIDVQRLFVAMTLDVIGAIAFDKNMGGLDGSRDTLNLILAAGHITGDIHRNPLKEIYCKLFPSSQAGRHRSSVVGRLRDEWKELTDEILARDDPDNGEEPLWYGLKHLADPETKKRVDYDLLLAEVSGVVVSGMDTTGHQVGWIFAVLASRPDVMDKVVDELERNGLHGENRRDLRFEDLSSLVYLTAVVKEAMRVAHMMAAGFRRRVPRDMSVLGYRVPKGTMIVQGGNRVFNVDTDWDDPESFKPERYLSDEETSRLYNMMFSTGPRDCPGQKLAMLEMRVAIIFVLQRYEISLAGSYADLANNTVEGLVTEAIGGIWLNFVPREASPQRG